MPPEPSIKAVVTQRFSASAERVYDAWLDPSRLGRWMFGPAVRDEQIVRLGIEPRVGGEFSFVVKRHGTEIDHLGEYLELDRPRRLVFTWTTRDNLPDTSKVVIEITPLAEGCELTLTHELSEAWKDYVDRTAASWRMMLGKLADALE